MKEGSMGELSPPPRTSGGHEVVENTDDESLPDLISGASSLGKESSVKNADEAWKAAGMRSGFLNSKANPKQLASEPQGQQGPSFKEQTQRPPSASQQAPPPNAPIRKARGAGAPEMAPLSHLSGIQRECQKEQDTLMRQLQVNSLKERAEVDGCLGRCCLRPGSLGFGGKWSCDKPSFKVKESERRLHMSCSEGCALLFHFPTCWHNYKDGYRALLGSEVEDVVLKGKKKVTPFQCLTDGCSGYIRQATLLEGPRGDSFKQKQYVIPPELEEQSQAAKVKKREDTVARCNKRKPAEQEAVDAAFSTGKDSKREKMARKGEASLTHQADKPVGAEAGGQGVEKQERWAEMGGMSYCSKKEAGSGERGAERARDAASKEAMAAAKEVQKVMPGRGIRIARRAQPELHRLQPPAAGMGAEDDVAQPLPEFLIPDDTTLKPLHKVAEEKEEAEAEGQRLQAGAVHAHKEVQGQKHGGQQNQPAGAESSRQEGVESKLAKRKKKKAMKLDLGSLWQETGGTEQQDAGTDEALLDWEGAKPFGYDRENQIRMLAAQGGAAATGQPRTFSMSHFPTLGDAVTAPRSEKEKEEVTLMDDMLGVLQQLKLSFSEMRQTQHLLLECVDILFILEQGNSVEDVISSLCADAGAEVIQIEVFERQEAVAITTANVEQAQHCMVQLQLQQLHRRKIQLCFLEEFPSHALLNQLMADKCIEDKDQASSTTAMTSHFPLLSRAPGSRPPLPHHSMNTPTYPIPPPPPPARGSLAASATASAATVGSPSHNPNPTASVFASSMAFGAGASFATPSCSRASSQVGAPDATSPTTAAINASAARHLHQQRAHQQQGPDGIQTGRGELLRSAEDEEEAVLQLVLEVSKQGMHIRKQQQEEVDSAQAAAPAASPCSAARAPPPTARAVAPKLLAELVQWFDALHFSNTDNQVLGHYRAYAQFKLPSNCFRDPHLINAPERCALALFNIDTQMLEGLWQATAFDAATQYVHFGRVMDSPPLPIKQVKVMLDCAGVSLVPGPVDSIRSSMNHESKLSGPLARAVVHMMLLGPQAPLHTVSRPQQPEAPLAAPPAPPRPSSSLILAASVASSPSPTSSAAPSPQPFTVTRHVPGPSAPTMMPLLPQGRSQPPPLPPAVTTAPPPSTATVPMPHVALNGALQTSLRSAPHPHPPHAAAAPPARRSVPATMAAAATIAPTTVGTLVSTAAGCPPSLATQLPTTTIPPAQPPRPAIPFLPPALAHLMSSRMPFRPQPQTKPQPQSQTLQQAQPQQAQPLQPQLQQPIFATAVRPAHPALSPPPFASPSPPVSALTTPLPSLSPSVSTAMMPQHFALAPRLTDPTTASPPTPPSAPSTTASPLKPPSAPTTTASPPIPPSAPPTSISPPIPPSAPPTSVSPPIPPSAPPTIASPPITPSAPPTTASPPVPASAPSCASPPLQAPGSNVAASTAKPSIQARLMCVICGVRRATWLNMVCKHMGPCEVCLPQGEAAYTQCHKCGGGSKLRRVF